MGSVIGRLLCPLKTEITKNVRKASQMDKLYLSAREAAEYVGIGINAMHDVLNSRDHPLYLVVGNAKRVRKDALREYFEKREIK